MLRVIAYSTNVLRGFIPERKNAKHNLSMQAFIHRQSHGGFFCLFCQREMTLFYLILLVAR
jgi:hypothetical protein